MSFSLVSFESLFQPLTVCLHDKLSRKLPHVYHHAETTMAANFRVTSCRIKVIECLSSFALATCSHWVWLGSVLRLLQGYVGNDSPSDVFMWVAVPSVSLRCSEKVADVPTPCLMDGARRCQPLICCGRPIPLDPPVTSRTSTDALQEPEPQIHSC